MRCSGQDPNPNEECRCEQHRALVGQLMPKIILMTCAGWGAAGRAHNNTDWTERINAIIAKRCNDY